MKIRIGETYSAYPMLNAFTGAAKYYVIGQKRWGSNSLLVKLPQSASSTSCNSETQSGIEKSGKPTIILVFCASPKWRECKELTSNDTYTDEDWTEVKSTYVTVMIQVFDQIL
ncbi:hypothetical protein Trydic_g20939 [Trypoxylus dichotomus]